VRPETAIRLLCDYLVPVLLALLLLISWSTTQGNPLKTRFRLFAHFWGKAILLISVPVLLAEGGKAVEIWQGHPGFPSGHSTMAFAVASCLWLCRPGFWGLIGFWLASFMPSALMLHGAHDMPEVACGAVLGLSLPFLIWQGLAQYKAKQPVTHP
jgi:membrane-associated phospholipid phosphatase